MVQEYFCSRNILITKIFSYAVEDHESHARRTSHLGQTCHVHLVGIMGHECNAGHGLVQIAKLGKKKINRVKTLRKSVVTNHIYGRVAFLLF